MSQLKNPNQVSNLTAALIWTAAAGAVFAAARYAPPRGGEREQAMQYVDCKLDEVQKLAVIARKSQETGIVTPELAAARKEGVNVVVTRACEAKTGYTEEQLNELRRRMSDPAHDVTP